MFFLCFPEVPARKILLHHILIQSGHYDDNEDTTEELFEEVLPGYPVVKYKNTAVFAVLDCLHNAAEVKV